MRKKSYFKQKNKNIQVKLLIMIDILSAYIKKLNWIDSIIHNNWYYFLNKNDFLIYLLPLH
jgi:hypothetical protein